MPDPSKSQEIKRLQGFSKQMQETYGGFEPKRMKAMLEKRGRQAKSVPNAIGREAEKTADAVSRQAKQDFSEIKGAAKKLGKKLGL